MYIYMCSSNIPREVGPIGNLPSSPKLLMKLALKENVLKKLVKLGICHGISTEVPNNSTVIDVFGPI
jgi:hypothetical protein